MLALDACACAYDHDHHYAAAQEAVIYFLLSTFYFLLSTFYVLLSTSPSFLLPLLDSTLYSIGVETYLLLLLLLTVNGKWAVWSRPLVKAVGQGRLVTE